MLVRIGSVMSRSPGGTGVPASLLGEVFYSRLNNETNQSNISIVNQLLAASFVASPTGTPSSAVVTVRGPVFNAYIGHKAASGNAYDFASTPVAIKFGGSSSLSAACNVLTDSDPIAFSWNGTSDILIAYEELGAQNFPSNDTFAGANAYYKFTTGDTGSVTKSSYSVLASRVYGVEALRLSGFAAAAPVRNKRIVADGNSLIVGYASTNPTENAIPSQIISLLRYGSSQVNLGVPSATTAERKAADSTLAAFQPGSIAVLWEVTNHLKSGASTSTALSTYWAWCDQVRAEGYKVVAMTILPRSEGDIYPGFETDRQTVNAGIVAGWSSHADALADVGNDSTIGAPGASNNATYYVDKTHMTEAGQAIAANIITAAILTL